jgi:hypothetical protein
LLCACQGLDSELCAFGRQTWNLRLDHQVKATHSGTQASLRAGPALARDVKFH